MGEDVAGGVLWYVVRNAPTFLAMFYLMLLAVRGRLRFSLGVTVGMALGIVAAVSLACGIGVAVFAGEEGVWATVPVLAVSLLSLAALTKLPWGKRLFVFFSAATAAAIAILAYDVLLRTVALEWSFGARRVLDAVVCSAGPLVLAPLFARTICWGVEQVDDPALWRRLAAVPAGFFVAANALYMFAYAVEFLSSGSDALYALAVGVLAFLMVASYLMLLLGPAHRHGERAPARGGPAGRAAARALSEPGGAPCATPPRPVTTSAISCWSSDRSPTRTTCRACARTSTSRVPARRSASRAPTRSTSPWTPWPRTSPSGREPAAPTCRWPSRLPERLPLPETDFCMAMANLLENAVEACERAERGEGGAGGRGSTAQDGARPLFVDAEARIEGNAVLVSVRNSCTPSDTRALAAAAPDGVLSSDARSAKREGDGIGLASVATLAKRYRGEVQVEIDEYAATIHVLLFAGDAR